MTGWFSDRRAALARAGVILLSFIRGLRIGRDDRIVGDVSAAPKVRRPVSVVARIDGARRCSLCMGVLKGDLPSLECVCGNRFHQSCAVRMGICPGCGREIWISSSKTGLLDPYASPIRQMPLMKEDRLYLLEDKLLLGEIDIEAYRQLREEMIDSLPDSRICPDCGARLYPGEECGCGELRPIDCPECGREIGPEEPFCRSCGVVVREDFSGELFQCSACGRVVVSSERICTCGAALLDPGDLVCPDCWHPVPAESRSCPNCGRVLFIQLLECPVCGQEVSPDDFECDCGVVFQDRIERIECPECGEVVGLDDRFCRRCGVRFSEHVLSKVYPKR